MAARTLFPQNDLTIGDRQGNVYRIFTVHVPEISVVHEIQMGVGGLAGIGLLEKPSGASDPTITAPVGTDGTGGTDSDDQNTKVGINASSLGDYKLVVMHKGRNAAAL